MAWYGKISELNIWKEGSDNKRLTSCKRKQIQGNGKVLEFYMGYQLLDTDIEMLNLSIRSYNCLRRAGWNKIKDILENIDTWNDLKKVRNLGNTSAIEIMNKLEEYQKSIVGNNPSTKKESPVRRSSETVGVIDFVW